MTLYRVTLSGLVICVYGGLLLLRAAGFQGAYNDILYGLGIIPFKFPFVDAHALLAAAQCHRAGVDVFVSNPCDVLGRVLPYPPIWLAIVPPFLTTAYTPVMGAAFNLAFLAALYTILRPSSWREWIVLALACVSTDVTFAVERGNADLLIFALGALAVVLYERRPWARGAAYATCFFAGMLKIYPFVLMTICLREPPRQFVKIAGAAGIALLVLVAHYHTEIVEEFRVIPYGTYFGDLFGAKNLPFGLVALLTGPMDIGRRALGYLIFLAAATACVAMAVALVRRFDARQVRIDWNTHRARCMLVGSLLIVGCFFAGQSIGYRGIHLLFVLPGVMMLRRSIADHALKRVLSVTLGAVVFLMWQEGIRHGFEIGLRLIGSPHRIPGIPSQIFWVMRELTWWWVVGVLTAIVSVFVIQSPSARAIVALWNARRPALEDGGSRAPA